MSDPDETFEPETDYDPPPERLQAPEEDDEGLNWRLVLGVLVSAAVIGMLVVDGLGSETYFFTVDEALTHASSVEGQKIRVKGKVVDGSIESYDDRVGRSFTISAKGQTLRVEYDEAMPDTFKEGVQVVATGSLDSNQTLTAEEVLVKCPSRYEGKPPTAHEKKGPRAER